MKRRSNFSSDNYDVAIDMAESGYSENEIINALGMNKNELMELKKEIYKDM